MTRLLLLMVLVSMQARCFAQLFPIPGNMQERWNSSGLAKADTQSLRHMLENEAKRLKAALPDECDNPQFEWTPVNLGKLGDAVIVKTDSPCNCGRANCAISLYVRSGAGYRVLSLAPAVHEPSGWAFGFLPSATGVPDIVIASAAGGLMVSLARYRYTDGKYMFGSSECIKQKDTENPGSWWNQANVVVSRSCESAE